MYRIFILLDMNFQTILVSEYITYRITLRIRINYAGLECTFFVTVERA